MYFQGPAPDRLEFTLVRRGIKVGESLGKHVESRYGLLGDGEHMRTVSAKQTSPLYRVGFARAIDAGEIEDRRGEIECLNEPWFPAAWRESVREAHDKRHVNQ